MGALLIANSSRGKVEKGDIWEIRHQDMSMTQKEAESYVLVKITDKLMTELDEYAEQWNIDIDWEIVNHQTSTDGYRIRAWSETYSTGGLGGLTEDKVENYLDKWNASIFSYDSNEVVFDFSVYLLATSQNFWEHQRFPADDIDWSEISYNESMGVHRISADYSGLGSSNAAWIERRLSRVLQDPDDGTIISHDSGVLVFEIDRNVILSLFKLKMKKKISEAFSVKSRRWKLSNAAVNNIISQGGVVTYDFSTVEGYLQDKLIVD